MTSKWTLDPSHDILWAYDPQKEIVSAYSTWCLNVEKAKGAQEFLRSPEFWLPTTSGPDGVIPATQLGLSVLSTVYALTQNYAQESLKADSITAHLNFGSSAGNGECGYRSVGRFQSYGGGWGYSAQSVEALQFQPSQDIWVVGLGLYGGRGEYVVRIKILRLIGHDYDERNLELLSESEEMIYDCPPKETAHLFFPSPVHCSSGHWYIAWAQINGPSSDCGAAGQTIIVAEDGVSFQFRNSHLSNNGTDVHVGQIPGILYRSTAAVTPGSPNEDLHGSHCSSDILVGSCRLKSILLGNADVMKILFALLSWVLRNCFQSKEVITSSDLALWYREQVVVIGIMTLRLIGFYLKAKLPNKGSSLNCVKLCQSVRNRSPRSLDENMNVC